MTGFLMAVIPSFGKNERISKKFLCQLCQYFCPIPYYIKISLNRIRHFHSICSHLNKFKNSA